ncbi:unnamed protein product [Dracunculus medinensis]|uniref:EF-hand domain-containing protein n=1 Tax=Dracunculus medinensis TaxID=318479 RepID=A0A0N4U2K2_DRAME|nr:unnamed protein product [Dracunculus medinensis]
MIQIMSQNSSSSPTCSLSSIRSYSVDSSDELAMKLARRNKIIEGETVDAVVARHPSIYAEFSEFSRKQIKYFIETFKNLNSFQIASTKQFADFIRILQFMQPFIVRISFLNISRFDEDGDSFIDFNELKRMMEKLGEAQTHITLKQILKMVDEDEDGKICLREFLLIFRYSLTNRLMCSNVFNELALSVDVAKEGVQAAANFFQAKIEELSKLSKFEEEIRAEREEKRQAEFEKKERRQQFLANRAVFHS